MNWPDVQLRVSEVTCGSLDGDAPVAGVYTPVVRGFFPVLGTTWE